MRKIIVIEKLKGLKRNIKRDKKIRKILHRWCYNDLIKKIKYKDKLKEIPVIEVLPR